MAATNSLTAFSTRRVAWIFLCLPQIVALGGSFFTPPDPLFDRALGTVVFLFAAAVVGYGLMLLHKRSVIIIDEHGIAFSTTDVPVPWSEVE